MQTGELSTFYSELKYALHNRKLPGLAAQLQLAIIGRRAFEYIPKNAKQAAVCAVLYPEKVDRFRIAYIQRTVHEKDRHSGQISFPGGQVEKLDVDLRHTALRELLEETGIEAHNHQILGSLTSLYIPVSNFQVHPFVIGLPTKPSVFKQDDEVDDIFGYGIYRLLNLPILYKTISGGEFTIKRAPYFDLDGRTLWGATAMMTNELLEVIRSIS